MRPLIVAILLVLLILKSGAQGAESMSAAVDGAAQAMPDVAVDAPGAGNPILPGYFADPTIIVHDGTFYIYATTDGPAWDATELGVWHSPDLRRWSFALLNWPSPESIPGANVISVWAPDVIEGPDGRFYMYVSIDHAVWAGVADHPLGPWRNLLDEDRPLIARDFDPAVHHIDAQAFIDDDGQAYLYWGSGWDWKRGPAYFAPLEDDMHTFAEPPRKIHPPNFFEGSYMIKRNGRYLLMYSDGKVSEPSYKIRYAWAPAPDGPWTEPEASPILVTNDDKTVHGPGHHSVLRWEGEDYLVYHRDAWPHMGSAFRQVCIDRITYDEQGLIERVVPTHRGALPPIPDTRPENPAQDRPTTATAALEGYGPERAVDANYGTRWSAPEGAWPASWQVDLGEVQTIGSVRIEPEYPTKYYRWRVEVSDDGETWTPFGGSGKELERGSPLVARGEAEARHVRITFEGGEAVTATRASMWEVQVEGPVQDETRTKQGRGTD